MCVKLSKPNFTLSIYNFIYQKYKIIKTNNKYKIIKTNNKYLKNKKIYILYIEKYVE